MDEIKLGGRRFRVIDFERRTVINDHYLMKWIRFIGADKVIAMEGEDSAAYLVRLQTCILDSGKAAELIAGYLLPEGVDEQSWTPEVAKLTAAHINKCDTQDDREQVLSLAMEVTFGFFRQGLNWLNRFQNSLADKGQSGPSETPGVTALH